jgi:23S rRNA (uracil1939-C5)-methyltransferase
MKLEGNIFEGEVLRLAFGGMGVMRYDGLVVFVPFVVPGEQVKAKIRKQHKNFAEAEALEILKPSPFRRQPLCPYFQKCGGCQLQHIAYEEQTVQKCHFVDDAMTRIGKLTLPEPVSIVSSETEWAYRRHVRLTLFTEDETYRVGYVGMDDQTLISVQQCPIFASLTDPIISEVGQLVSQFTYIGDVRGHASVIKDGADGYVLFFDFPENTPANIKDVLQNAIQTQRTIVGAVWKDGKHFNRLGKTECHFTINDLKIAYSPTVFVQNHPEQSAHIYHRIAAFANQIRAKTVLDLYCGIGVTSLLLERQGAAVIGIEGNPDSVQLAKHNAENNGCGNVIFERADVAKIIRRMCRLHFDLVILNPPRTGADSHILKVIADSEIKHIAYISCMPATLARDLTLLCGLGYSIDATQAYDMFPQTTHVETVVFLTHQTVRS